MSLDDRMCLDPAATDMLIVVDENDTQLGVASKLDVHTQGLLHRAFSVVLIREGSCGKEMLLTQRSKEKYHSGGLWTNSCCSHPRAGETLEEAVGRRLYEELGIVDVNCVETGSFIYRAEFSNGIVEHEFDHVFLGVYDGTVFANPQEVADYRWATPKMVEQDLAAHPETYTVWFRRVLERACRNLGSLG